MCRRVFEAVNSWVTDVSGRPLYPMSQQNLHDVSTQACPHCDGTGDVRGVVLMTLELHAAVLGVTEALEGFVRLVDKGDYGPWDFQAAYEQAKEAIAVLRKPAGSPAGEGGE